MKKPFLIVLPLLALASIALVNCNPVTSESGDAGGEAFDAGPVVIDAGPNVCTWGAGNWGECNWGP